MQCCFGSPLLVGQMWRTFEYRTVSRTTSEASGQRQQTVRSTANLKWKKLRIIYSEETFRGSTSCGFAAVVPVVAAVLVNGAG